MSESISIYTLYPAGIFNIMSILSILWPCQNRRGILFYLFYRILEIRKPVSTQLLAKRLHQKVVFLFSRFLGRFFLPSFMSWRPELGEWVQFLTAPWPLGQTAVSVWMYTTVRVYFSVSISPCLFLFRNVYDCLSIIEKIVSYQGWWFPPSRITKTSETSSSLNSFKYMS